jgi:hypothetical protein
MLDTLLRICCKAYLSRLYQRFSQNVPAQLDVTQASPQFGLMAEGSWPGFAMDTQLSRRSFTPSPSTSPAGITVLASDPWLVPASFVADTTQT